MEDVEACVDAGADLVGFNFWPKSKRFVRPEEAASLVARVPRSVLTVGVFVSAPPEEVARSVGASGVQVIQLHGDEDPVRYSAVPAQIIQVVRIKGEDSAPPNVPDAVRYVLLDAFVEGYGGAGRTFDWSLVPRIVSGLQRDVLLGGGLTPENVAEAVRVARPWGVDVASGVESSPGIKIGEKVAEFVARAKAAARSV